MELLVVHWGYWWFIGAIGGSLGLLVVHWGYWWFIGAIGGSPELLVVHWGYWWFTGATGWFKLNLKTCSEDTSGGGGGVLPGLETRGMIWLLDSV